MSLQAVSGRKTSISKLNKVSAIYGFDSPHDYPWVELDYIKVSRIIESLELAGLSYSTINGTLSAIKGVCKQAWLANAMDGDVYAKIKAVPQRKGSRLPAGQALVSHDVDKLFNVIDFDNIKDLRNAVVLTLGFDLGFRRTEIAELKLDQVHLKDMSVSVIGKGNKERSVQLNDRSYSILKLWIERAENAKATSEDDIGRFLLGPTGKNNNIVDLKGIDPTTVWRAVKEIAFRADIGLDKLPSPHDMRRTKITSWLDYGDARIAQQLAGHKHIQTTMGYDRGDINEKMKDVQSRSSESAKPPVSLVKDND